MVDVNKIKTKMFRWIQDTGNLGTYPESKTVGDGLVNSDVCMERSASTTTQDEVNLRQTSFVST